MYLVGIKCFCESTTLLGLGSLKGHVGVSSICPKFEFISRSRRRLIFDYLSLMWQRTTSIYFQLIFNKTPRVWDASCCHFITRTLRVKYLTTESDFFSPKLSSLHRKDRSLPREASPSSLRGAHFFFLLSFHQTFGMLGGFLKTC